MATGEETAALLMRALPNEVAELVLGRLGSEASVRLRAALKAAEQAPPEALDVALAEFFDMLRILERHPNVAAEQKAKEQEQEAAAAAAKAASEVDPMEQLRALKPDLLFRALEGEPSPAVALILSCLEPGPAAQVLKRLSPELRAATALRLSQQGVRNHTLLQQMAKAVVAKAQTFTDLPEEPTPEERIQKLATMLRGLPRGDRILVLLKIEETDSELAKKVRAKIYGFKDLQRIEDRPLQSLLAEIEVKKIAIALKDAEPALAAKITNNISTRARDVLSEEMSLLGSVQSQAVEEARAEIVYLMRKHEEDGKIVIEG